MSNYQTIQNTLFASIQDARGGLKVKEIAERCGIAQNTMSALLRGKMPMSIARAVTILENLGHDVSVVIRKR